MRDGEGLFKSNTSKGGSPHAGAGFPALRLTRAVHEEGRVRLGNRRSRWHWLVARCATPDLLPMARPRPPVFELLLRLADVSTDVWRRVRISSGATLARAQRVFCVSFGWPGGRPHAFSAGPLRYESAGIDDPLVDLRLRQLLPDAGTSLEFEYGAGEPWRVLVRVERMLPAGDALATPRCVAGEGESPPLESGGANLWNERRALEAGEDCSDGVRRPPIGVNLDLLNAELERLR